MWRACRSSPTGTCDRPRRRRKFHRVRRSRRRCRRIDQEDPHPPRPSSKCPPCQSGRRTGTFLCRPYRSRFLARRSRSCIPSRGRRHRQEVSCRSWLRRSCWATCTPHPWRRSSDTGQRVRTCTDRKAALARRGRSRSRRSETRGSWWSPRRRGPCTSSLGGTCGTPRHRHRPHRARRSRRRRRDTGHEDPFRLPPGDTCRRSPAPRRTRTFRRTPTCSRHRRRRTRSRSPRPRYTTLPGPALSVARHRRRSRPAHPDRQQARRPDSEGRPEGCPRRASSAEPRRHRNRRPAP
jgi:hypothetical protein